MSEFHCDLNRLQGLVREHNEVIRHYYSGGLDVQIQGILRHYQDVATRSLETSKSFRDMVAVQLRALSLLVESVGNASTHAEKAARLRGLSELLESSIDQLRKVNFDVAYSHRYFPDLFRSDYPTRRFLDRIRELERENKELRERMPQEGGTADVADGQPF